ncbi:MAG: hypothetical protein IPM34_00685 [Saprospiraceae bacterium]|nr:hypothetical protein [Saprospiraceae bacterium]
MRHTLYFVAIIILWCTQLNSQQYEYYCAWTDLQNSNAKGSSDPCFDVQEIMDECIPIYLRINVHYFVNDDCQGKIQQENFDQNKVYENTERMIKILNNEIKHNQKQLKDSSGSAPCLPFRFVLKGVYTHCKSNAEGEGNIYNLHNEFGVNPSNEINFYIAHSPQGATGIGSSWYNTGSASRFNPDIWWTVGNLYHELGHILSLGHSFVSDGCDDTPIIKADWDKNCNGKIEPSQNRDLNEQGLTCWGQLSANVFPGEPGYADGNKNGIGDCDEMDPCSPSPCCLAENIDNNVMSYSSNKSALTTCQLTKMLNYINNNRCDLIEKIGGCPPASAFINQLPEDLVNDGKCVECLQLSGSWDETSYRLRIYEQSSNSIILVYDSGIKNGEATIFCFKTNAQYPGNYTLLKPLTNYVAELTSFNECSDDVYNYEFITNPPNCGVIGFDELEIIRNPVTGELILKITHGNGESGVRIEATHLATGTVYVLDENVNISSGQNYLYLNAFGLPQGSYVLGLKGPVHVSYENFLKL